MTEQIQQTKQDQVTAFQQWCRQRRFVIVQAAQDQPEMQPVAQAKVGE